MKCTAEDCNLITCNRKLALKYQQEQTKAGPREPASSVKSVY
jgi:hypothetical protein